MRSAPHLDGDEHLAAGLQVLAGRDLRLGVCLGEVHVDAHHLFRSSKESADRVVTVLSLQKALQGLRDTRTTQTVH